LCCCVFILKVCSAQCTLLITSVYLPHSLTPHTSHLTPHTSHLTPHTSHLTPHTSHPHILNLNSIPLSVLYCTVMYYSSPPPSYFQTTLFPYQVFISYLSLSTQPTTSIFVRGCIISPLNSNIIITIIISRRLVVKSSDNR
jgi:hypothetical protein